MAKRCAGFELSTLAGLHSLLFASKGVRVRMKRILLASVASGLALFLWGFLSWVALPWHNMTFHDLRDEARVAEALRAELPKTGTYFIPWINQAQMQDAAASEKAMAEMTDRHRQGPVAQIFFLAEGAEPMAPPVLLRGVVIDILIGLVAATLVGLTLGPNSTYARRFGVVMCSGLITVLMTHVTDWNFLYRPIDYTIVMCADHLVCAAVVGAVVAAIVKPTSVSSAT